MTAHRPLIDLRIASSGSNPSFAARGYPYADLPLSIAVVLVGLLSSWTCNLRETRRNATNTQQRPRTNNGIDQDWKWNS